MDILNNPWFIGIGGGILSGFIVTVVSRALLSRRDLREYAQKVLGANREVVYAVRPGISEGLVPTVDVLDSLVEATARKFGVDRKDLYRPFEIAQELMKEVMDSSFISAKTKEDYCSRLAVLAKPKTPPIPDEHKTAAEESASRVPPGVEEYRSRMVWMMSMMMGILAATMTLVLAFSKEGPLLALAFDSKSGLATVLLPVMLTIAAAGVSMLAMSVLRMQRDRSKDRERGAERKPPRQDEKPHDAP